MNKPSAALVAAIVLSSVAAHAAPTKDECLAANTIAQKSRRAGKLVTAREKLLVCSNDECPAIVRDDCIQRMDDVEKSLPTVVFEVKDASGADKIDVTVMVDGAPLASRLDGTALPIDPGEHEVTFDSPGVPRTTKKLVLREGDKGHHEAIVLGGVGPVVPDKTKPATLTIVTGPEDDIALDGNVVGVGRWSGPLTLGGHDLRVSHAGRKTHKSRLELGAGPRTVEVTLEKEDSGLLPLWAWIAGGVVIAGGAVTGIYFLTRSDEQTPSRPVGGLGTVTLSIPRF